MNRLFGGWRAFLLLLITALLIHVGLYFSLRNLSFTAYNNFSDNNNEEKLEKDLRTYKSSGLGALKELEFFLKQMGHWRGDEGGEKIFNREGAKKLCVGIISGTRSSLHHVTERESAGDINSPLIECVSSLLCGVQASMQGDIKILLINTEEPNPSHNEAIQMLRPYLRVDDTFTTTSLYKDIIPSKKDEREDITSLKRILMKRLKGITDYAHATKVMMAEQCEWNLILQSDALASRTKYPWAKELLNIIDTTLSTSSSMAILALFTEGRSLTWSFLNPTDYEIFYKNGLVIALVLWLSIFLLLNIFSKSDRKIDNSNSKKNETNTSAEPLIEKKNKLSRNAWLQEWNEDFSFLGSIILFIIGCSCIWVIGKANMMRKISQPSMVSQYPMPVWTKSFGMATANLYKGRNLSVLYHQIVKEIGESISNASADLEDDEVIPTMDKIIYNFVEKVQNDNGDAAEIGWTRPALFQRTGLFGSSQLELDLPPSRTSNWSLGMKRGAIEGNVMQQMALTRNFPDDGLSIVFDHRTWES